MPELEHAGLNAFDAQRAHSMEDEGGASAARVEAADAIGSGSRSTGRINLLAVLTGAVVAAAFVWWMRKR